MSGDAIEALEGVKQKRTDGYASDEQKQWHQDIQAQIRAKVEAGLIGPNAKPDAGAVGAAGGAGGGPAITDSLDASFKGLKASPLQAQLPVGLFDQPITSQAAQPQAVAGAQAVPNPAAAAAAQPQVTGERPAAQVARAIQQAPAERLSAPTTDVRDTEIQRQALRSQVGGVASRASTTSVPDQQVKTNEITTSAQGLAESGVAPADGHQASIVTGSTATDTNSDSGSGGDFTRGQR